MSVINILDPHLADMIAAGEVVERPASVVKELVENSFDAGARNVTVEIRHGGATYIRVSDDGCGMSPDDAGIAFLRHATSKLKTEFDLEAISTMGFRGEALAAISSVSRMEIVTRLRGADTGTRVLTDAGDITDMSVFGCPEGTTVVCRDLFYNTPARLKFLKSDRAESSACEQTAARCALGRPDISVRFIKDGDETFFTPGDGKTESALYSLIGREETVKMLPIESSIGKLSLNGFVSSPSEGRGNRAHQFFYVNGRNIKSSIIQAALEQAYRNTLLTGRYPSASLFLTIPFGSVDVNVHPTKMEVRFGDEKAIFDFIYHSVKDALEGEDRVSLPSFTGTEKRDTVPVQQEVLTPKPYHEQLSIPFAPSPVVAPRQNVQIEEKHNDFKPSEPHVENFVENSVQNVENPSLPDHKILCELFRTYIAVEQNGEILLIDKHAAHERVIFNKLQSQDREIASQYLMSAQNIRLSGSEKETLEANGELLAELGFEIEPFGDSEYIIRAVPRDMDPGEAAAAVEEILDKLSKNENVDPRDEILHTVACKAAIKAGWDNAPEELRVLVDKVVSGEIKYCPHGRPVSAVISRRDLDKLFKRIV